ncbi:MAG: peptidase M4 family protein [Lentisphaerae bacterium]|nr:peptidase M4 family protein [Lentisphaerota bacterium]MCP4100409.1 peptidase M4 family protein [Lentisphaerota bacterium]
MFESRSRRWKSTVAAAIVLFTTTGLMANSRLIRKSDSNALKNFHFQDSQVNATAMPGTRTVNSPYVSQENALQKITTAITFKGNIERYQQKFHGVEVYGAQVTVANKELNGKVEEAIGKDISVQDIAKYEDLNLQKQAAQKVFKDIKGKNLNSKLIVYPMKNSDQEKYVLAYYLQLRGDTKQPTAIVDCKTQEVYKRWNNIKDAIAKGVGGNKTTGQYYYGYDNLPAMDVSKSSTGKYTMDNGLIRVVDLNHDYSVDDNGYEINGPAYSWTGSNFLGSDYVNGAYNVKTDAYVFAGYIVEMYNDWMQMPCLQDSKGRQIKLIMRVHYSDLECTDQDGDGRPDDCVLNPNYNNAFWNGESMTFGDGDGQYMYPLVSLDIAGHEVSHGFTQHHSNLEYHDKSGALNESYSDIAAVAVMEYVRQKNIDLYSAIYPGSLGKIPWTVGETVMVSGKPLRFIDYPAEDGGSADCYRRVANGHITYKDVERQAKLRSRDPDRQQSYIVHMASGIYNRAFYLLSQKWGVEKAFRIFAFANVKYWTSQADFDSAANGVYNAARDLGYNPYDVVDIFRQVGVYAN